MYLIQQYTKDSCLTNLEVAVTVINVTKVEVAAATQLLDSRLSKTMIIHGN